MMTWKSFTTLDQLIDLLIQRYSIEPPSDLKPGELEDWTMHKQHVIQTR
jgi:son of sevenless-like protein